MSYHRPHGDSVREALDLFAEIERLKRQLNAVILAHYYQEPDIQDIADILGDSLALARDAQRTDAGIVNHVWDAEGFEAKVLEYAQQFVPPNKASKAVGRIKRSVQSGLEVGFQDSLAIERELQQQLFTSADAKEGLSAYVEKRQTRFSGK